MSLHKIIHYVGTNVGRWEEFVESLNMLNLSITMAESQKKDKMLFNHRKEWYFSPLTQQQLALEPAETIKIAL